MPQLAHERLHEILADPAFCELASARAKMRWGLSIMTLIMFFGFIVLISTAREALGTHFGGSVIPLGLVLGLAMIAAVVMLTGFYVYRSNSRFDRLSLALQEEFGR